MSSKSSNHFVLPSISKMYLDAETADVKFVFTNDDETQLVPAHKSILATASPVFRAMFYGKLKEKEKVEIADATVAGFKEFLQFFYLSSVKLTMANIEEVARLADKYDMLEYLNSYADDLLDNGKLTIDRLCWAYQLAVIIKHDELNNFCEKHISAFTGDVFKSKTFLHCDQKILKHILGLETLMYNEIDIFEACLAWAKFSCEQNGIDSSKVENLKTQLGDCFNLIRFGAMSYDDFVTRTVEYEEIFTRDELAHILYKNAYKFITNKFSRIPRSNTLLKWDDTKMIACSQGVSNSNPVYYIQNPESVWFSTNVSVVLGEIHCFPVKNSSGYSTNTEFNVTVVEIDAQSFEVSATTKILFKKEMTITGDQETKAPLRQPLAINPNKMYEIRLDTATNVSGYYYHGLQWNSELKLNEKINVEFHSNPSNIERRGLVSRLCFNEF